MAEPPIDCPLDADPFDDLLNGGDLKRQAVREARHFQSLLSEQIAVDLAARLAIIDRTPRPTSQPPPRQPVRRQARPKKVRWTIEVDPELRELYRDLNVAIMLSGELDDTVNGLATDALWRHLETVCQERFGTDRPPPRGERQPRGGRRSGT